MTDTPFVTLLVLNWNGRALLERSLPRLLKQTYRPYRVVVVDNASTDDSAEFITTHYPTVTFIQNADNLGFSHGINAGLDALGPLEPDSLLLLLNNDVYVEPDWLSGFVAAWVSAENVGVAGCQLLFPNGSVQHLGGYLDNTAMSHHILQLDDPAATVVDVDYVTGAALLVSAETIQTLGSLDNFFSPFYYEETDFCYRIRAAGKRVVVFPQVNAIHDESSTVRQVTGLKAFAAQQNRLRFVLKQFSAEAFTNSFVPAEITRLQQPHDPAHLAVMRQILTDSILHAPAWLAGWQRSEDSAAILSGLLRLRDVAVTQSLNFRQVASTQLTEIDFVGHSPIFGQIRQAWHAVAAKWAIKHLREEQSHINTALTQAINQSQSTQTATSTELTQLLNHIAHLENRIRELDSAGSQFTIHNS